MLKTMTLLALTLFGVIASGTASAATIQVPADQPTIQDAINAAVDGDEVIVAPGVYNESINFFGKAITVASEQGPGVTTISAVGGSVVTFESGEGPGSVIRGFTLRNGNNTFGAGVAIWFTSPVVEDNIITENSGTIGGAIFLNGASPYIGRNLIHNNSAGGSGFLITAGIAIVNVSSPLIENNVIVNNLEGAGITLTLPDGAEPRIVNNVVAGNVGGGIKNDFFGAITITNNIIAGNTRGAGILTDFGNVPVVAFNDVWNNEGGDYGGILPDLTGTDGNISADPAFVAAASGDFRLLPGSVAIDAGTNDGAPPTDFDNNPRPVDGDGDGVATVDMGAFEFAQSGVQVAIDIKPGNKRNVLNPRSRGGVWVAVLSDAETPFDALQIDAATVAFGPAEASAIRFRVQDVNRDGLADLVLRFRIPATGIACGDTEATLTGQTHGGESFSGTDAVQTVGCR